MNTPIQSNQTSFLGYWKIMSMEVWGQKYIDLVVPGHITFEMEDDHLMGSFQFGTVTGWMDCRVLEMSDGPIVEWSWEGHNDADPACRRGRAHLEDGKLTGRLFSHASDDSAFEAVKQAPPKKQRQSTYAAPSRLRH